MKRENGITLIALVVTIIVLIILAAITINSLIGENGIIQKANQAKNEQEEAENKDQIGLNTLYDEMQNKIENQKELEPEPVKEWKYVKTVSSPDYPDFYPKNIILEDSETFSDEVVGVKISIKELFLEFDDFGQFDRLDIYNKNKEFIHSCYGRLQQDYILEGNYYNTKFFSDYGNNYRGFCYEIYTTTSQELVTPTEPVSTLYKGEPLALQFDEYTKKTQMVECQLEQPQTDLPLYVMIQCCAKQKEGETDQEFLARVGSYTTLDFKITVYDKNNQAIKEQTISPTIRKYEDKIWGNATQVSLKIDNISDEMKIELTTPMNPEEFNIFGTVVVGK